MPDGLSDAVLFDGPTESGGDAEIDNQRSGPRPGEWICEKHGDDHQQSNQCSQWCKNHGGDGIRMELEDVLRQAPESAKQITQNAASPTQLLIEKDRQRGGNGGPAEGVVVDVGSVTAHQ